MTLPSCPPVPLPLRPGAERGVVLIIAMILLVVISLLAITSLRNVGSTENVMGNVRTTELATQAAELALRYCETAVVNNVKSGTPLPVGMTLLPASTPPQWQSLPTWDSTSNATFVLPESVVNETALLKTYQRFPECMVEPLPVLLQGSSTPSSTASFVVTSRGFGPEVPAVDAARSRPQGTEVWLQSTIELQ